MRRTGLIVGLIASCAACKEWERFPAPPASQAVVLRASGEGEANGVALWQGFDLRWGYNHRVNRVGSLLTQEPGGCPRSEPTAPVCQPSVVVAAASGTGPDTAAIRTFVSMVGAREVGFATALQELVLRGQEGQPIVAEATVDVPLSTFSAGQPTHVALLNGFDLYALDSADKLVHFDVGVGAPQVSGSVARVPVRAEATFDCSSAECPRGSEVDYSLWLAVVVASGAAPALEVVPVEAKHQYAWDEKVELADALVRAPLTVAGHRVDHVLAIRGFSLRLPDERHLLQWGVSVDGTPGAELRFKNWRPDMKNVSPPASFTSYREAGSVDWGADLVALRFGEASVAPVVTEGEVKWEGWGASASEREGPATRVRALPFALRAEAGAPKGQEPIEKGGFSLLAAEVPRDPFQGLREAALSRSVPPAPGGCPAGAPPVTPELAAGWARALLEDGALVEAAARGVVEAKVDAGSAHGEERMVAGDGSSGGGAVLVGPAEAGSRLAFEDWWGTVDGRAVDLDGEAERAADGARVRFTGVLAGTDPARPAWRGTLTRSVATGGEVAAEARVVGACGEAVEVEGRLPVGAEGAVTVRIGEVEQVFRARSTDGKVVVEPKG